MARYIDADELRRNASFSTTDFDVGVYLAEHGCSDVVEAEKYNNLRESFADFVCSGVHNPAPYCKNACDECVDSRGWCTYRRCNGFNPDGRGGEE